MSQGYLGKGLGCVESGRLAVIGLGYVGLPLAVEFARKRKVVAFDISQERISELREHKDSTLEVGSCDLEEVESNILYTSDTQQLSDCNIYVVTVPTPIDLHKQPDLSPLLSASKMLGEVLKPGDIVIYESTVYPGATEEVCVPELEAASGLSFNKDFFVGYSPERINPGDKRHRLPDIRKVTSGSTPEVAQFIDDLYSTIIAAGTYKAKSIRIAEAAKVIENTQRDLNIALVNELAVIFNRMGIDTNDVLEAAGTKWNFLPFRPGLVGGHCIGVDPYYLTYKAKEIGYNPEIILAGRRLNDRMGEYVVQQLVREMIRHRIQVNGARVLLMGFSFKENCPDVRNTRVIDVYRELASFGAHIDVYDPWVDPSDVRADYSIGLKEAPDVNAYDAIVIAVAHDQFVEMGFDAVRAFCKKKCVIYDLKNVYPGENVTLRL